MAVGLTPEGNVAPTPKRSDPGISEKSSPATRKAKPAPVDPEVSKGRILARVAQTRWHFFPPTQVTDGEAFIQLSAEDAEHAADPTYWAEVILPKLP